jgi:hypothetical protein
MRLVNLASKKMKSAQELSSGFLVERQIYLIGMMSRLLSRDWLQNRRLIPIKHKSAFSTSGFPSRKVHFALTRREPWAGEHEEPTAMVEGQNPADRASSLPR